MVSCVLPLQPQKRIDDFTFHCIGNVIGDASLDWEPYIVLCFYRALYSVKICTGPHLEYLPVKGQSYSRLHHWILCVFCGSNDSPSVLPLSFPAATLSILCLLPQSPSGIQCAYSYMPCLTFPIHVLTFFIIGYIPSDRSPCFGRQVRVLRVP